MATLRQEKALKKLVENGGNVGKAMLDAGYSPATAKTPQKLTKSKGWKNLVEKYLPDELLTERHNHALFATKIHGSPTEPDKVVEDIPTQLRAVELGYKIKGYLKEGVFQQFNAEDMKLDIYDSEGNLLKEIS